MGETDLRRANRVTMGLSPAVYDRYDKTYPTDTTEKIVYSVRNSEGILEVVGIVEITYTDSTRRVEASGERIAII